MRRLSAAAAYTVLRISAVFFLCIGTAPASWVFDSSSGILSDGNWQIFVQKIKDSDNYSVGRNVNGAGYVAGSGALDMSGVTADTGIVISELSGGSFFGIKVITSVVLPDTVKTIRENAFANCTGITDAVLPSELESLEYRAFYNATSLTNITPMLPPSVSYIGSSVFQLAPISGILDLSENEEITSISPWAFSGTRLTEARLQNVTNISNDAFSSNPSLGKVFLSENLEAVGSSAFSECTSLTNVTPFLPDSLSFLGGKSFHKTAVEGELVVSNPAVTEIPAWTFMQSRITSARIPYVEEIGQGVFQSCAQLKTLQICSRIKAINSSAFKSCAELETIEPEMFPGTLSYVGLEAFYACRKLSGEISFVNPGLTNFPNSVLNACNSVTKITMPRTSASIGDWSFLGLAPGAEIYFPGEAPSSIGKNSAFTTTSSANPCVIYASLTMDEPGWRSYAEELTESDRVKTSFPGNKTFGVFVSGGQRNWMVDWHSPLESGPMTLLLR